MSYCSCSNWMLIANERLFHRIYYRIWLVSVTIDDSNLLHPKSIAFNWKMSVVWVLASMSANICIYFSTLDMHFPVTNNFESNCDRTYKRENQTYCQICSLFCLLPFIDDSMLYYFHPKTLLFLQNCQTKMEFNLTIFKAFHFDP